MGEGERCQLGTVGALSLSVVSSVSIVICNKALISSLGFTFATTLTSWHLLVTFCSLQVALWMKFFEHKPFDSRTVMGFGILNGISIGLLNLSLGFNSVGFYQMTKLAIIPCTVLLETLFFRKKFSRSIQLSLTILLFGVGIATVTDLQLNILGSILSLLAVVTTCIAQIMTNTIQKKFKVSSTQLLYQSCPYQALTLFIIGPFLDGFLTDRNVFAFQYTPLVLLFIVLSCLISVSVNFSTFLVIGKTSPVTYQVLGHLKTCLVLAFGYVLLHDPFSWRNILGILIALIGMISYSYFCTIESQQKASEASAQIPQVRESESTPLITVDNGSSAVSGGTDLKAPAWSSNKDLRA
ncbi:uncharacterized membrane protein At1g06890-like isoform X1 [Ananas comosus]|nr:uncharacterized membrane protein At1g06890-like isoform X1 [Ananas comosus]XP_020103644.1 uncharacterized membrane protein At1g06890-like isoform X1 [Ananas comosus]OAY65015.1 putative membrane protein [Ananas comosus]